ncbi:NepR family anti-sigma factor [Novosphingobium aquiterrae]|uniref:NepR family anti-sigma factor n=1 Tax=Novosphingobium aquiterrae TaxID=624388 RepID=A0ABV6PGT7_9SPHN
MTDQDFSKSGKSKDGDPKKTASPRQPGWADGLRKLYDSVANEPLPDSFDDLLKKLDQADDV